MKHHPFHHHSEIHEMAAWGPDDGRPVMPMGKAALWAIIGGAPWVLIFWALWTMGPK